MIAFIMLLIIVTLSFGIKIKLKISQEESLIIAVFGLGILGYLLGLIEILDISIYIIVALSIISTIYTIIKLKRKEVHIKDIITLPTIIYSITLILIYYIVKDVNFIYYDEYMFWGTNLKAMISKSCLWASSKIEGIHLVYPPFTAIIEYLFCKFNGEFNEGVAYFGIATLMLTTIMPIFKQEKYNIKSLIKIILTITITYIAIILFNYNITCLSVDCTLAILFAVSMFLAYQVKDKKDYIILSILLISITLTKTNGILFAGIVIMQLFIKNIFSNKKLKESKQIGKSFLMIGILLVTIITAYGTWKIYCVINKKQIDDRHDKNYTQNIDIKEFINAITFNDEASDRNKKIVSDFFEKLKDEKIIIKYEFNTAICVLTIVNTIFLLYFLITKNKRNKLAYFVSINIGFILYIMTNLIVYMFVFQETQGTQIASFTRYINTYLLAMVLNLVFFILEKTEWKTLLIAFIMLLLMGKGLNQLMLDPRIESSMNFERQIIARKADQIVENVSKNEKVYIVDQKLDYGTEFMQLRYFIAPIETNLLYEWNIGYEQDGVFYKMALTQEEFIDKIIEENYDYVYIINIKENFLEEYKDIFTEEAKKELQDIITEDEKNIIVSREGVILKINKETRKIESI